MQVITETSSAAMRCEPASPPAAYSVFHPAVLILKIVSKQTNIFGQDQDIKSDKDTRNCLETPRDKTLFRDLTSQILISFCA